MKCETCGGENLTEKELDIHTRYFHKHKVGQSTPGQPAQQFASGVCPDCGSTLWYQEGCATCRGCGFSKCG